MTLYHEVNFDGLIGPTHNYAGLAIGNLASDRNKGATSNPRAAVLQGLAKMRALTKLGLRQGFLPPQERPRLDILRAFGFQGTDRQVIDAAARVAPDLLANCYSASSMWTANAATVAPSIDAEDGKVHFTAANLAGNFHRSIEAAETARILRHVFPDASRFAHHPPLPGGVHFGDEGAANHGRLAPSHSESGVHLFVYGEDGEKFPARQKRAASEAVARNHQLSADRCIFAQQSRAALDAGAFHNDVVGVANGNVLFLHEQSFEDRDRAFAEIRAAAPFVEIVEASAADVSLGDAVSSYLFNSQLATLPDGSMALILPRETEENDAARAFVERTVAGNGPIAAAHYFDVRESMRNGGGPACLRLRILLNEAELSGMNQNFILDDAAIDKLEAWAEAHYRDRLHPDDLKDPVFMQETFAALEALTRILGMGSYYSFQR
ncbi:MAG: N-succinylarginine dihydrolase [Alphaproteobacteria bacterium]|nr:N-succinylarginine dihydrolase [Alphaproteobacteria bacterium]